MGRHTNGRRKQESLNARGSQRTQVQILHKLEAIHVSVRCPSSQHYTFDIGVKQMVMIYSYTG
jgi:hypothetical protein